MEPEQATDEVSTSRVITPCDVTVLFGVATNAEQYGPAHDRRDDRLLEAIPYDRYLKYVEGPIQHHIPRWRALGAKVIEGATLRECAQAFNPTAPCAVILFSHWSNGIQMGTSFVGPQSLVDQIPDVQEAVLDLCVCTPARIAREVVDRRDGLAVAFSDFELDPGPWLAFYDTVLRILEAERLSYENAWRLVRKNWLRRLREARNGG